MDLNRLRVNPVKAAGVWIPYHDGKLLIGSANGTGYRNARAAKLKQAQLVARGGITDADARRITIDSMAEAILLGWEGLEDNGKQIEYSKETAVKLLTEIPIFMDDVSTLANDLSMFSEASVAEGVKVLGEGSHGTSITEAS